MALFLIPIAVILILVFIRNKHKKFVSENSLALNALREINFKHAFLPIACLDMSHDYDNKDFYQTISPNDYLTYQLIYQQKTVQKAIEDAAENSRRMVLYQTDVVSINSFGQFEDLSQVSKIDKLLRCYWLSKGMERTRAIEQSLFQSETKRPITDIKIKVTLNLTNIQGRKLDHKEAVFSTVRIETIVAKLHDQTNGFYHDPDIWQAICRVERGKVSNKMRFAIYKRDGNCCKRCGSTSNLEIDHIFPISKGGKSTFDNLQTLCHNCNTQKGNSIDRNALMSRNTQKNAPRICPHCQIPLTKRRGSYGEFWGCPNYPRCKYSSK